MSKQSSHEQTPLRAVTTDREVRETDSTWTDGFTDGNSVQQIWEIVRKSTDVIASLREENAILRSELAAIRKSEQVMQERVQGFLSRIEQLEKAPMRAVNPIPSPGVDRVEDREKSPSRYSSKSKITITIEDNEAAGAQARINEAVHRLIDEIRKELR